jgi:glucose/arabinose dehydrogenase
MRDGNPLTTFLTVNMITAGGEQGLFSMAFAPDYATSRKFYVYYTDLDGDMVVAEYLRDAVNPDIADPGTRRIVLEIPHPTEENHNGGQLQFGPDGYLYLATGDGGGGGDPFRSAQDLEDLRGKMLRIDPELGPNDEPYTIPADNPFVGVAGRDEIWAYGFRNPWRFSFDRQTGDLTIADVGEGDWEEIDFAPGPNAGRGMNFGWAVTRADTSTGLPGSAIRSHRTTFNPYGSTRTYRAVQSAPTEPRSTHMGVLARLGPVLDHRGLCRSRSSFARAGRALRLHRLV